MTDHNQSSFLRYLQWRYLIVALFVLGVFIYGVGVGLYKWMPFSTLQSIKQSVLNEYAEWGGVGQIAGITQLSELYDPDTLINYLQRSKTSWLFTRGKQERGACRIEAEESYTSSEIARLPNVEAHLHQGGHEFPVAVIRQWLKQQH